MVIATICSLLVISVEGTILNMVGLALHVIRDLPQSASVFATGLPLVLLAIGIMLIDANPSTSLIVNM
jgi:hypothetical protein